MLDQFQQLPKGMKILLAAMTGTSLVGVAAMIDPGAVLIVVVGLILIVLLIMAWRYFYLERKARKRALALSGQLTENSSAAPAAINDPARRAKLDDLRQNFAKGVAKFRAAGKDLYALPWYVVCGEPGSGKTEAVRHCNAGFPPGLQDEMQGAGGTLNMHWWFTNQAVLLDTAGKLLFQEAPPGTTSEWTEFLNLLRKSRPNCPINGLLLVIPAESLIRDSFEEIQRKAGKIARQLDTIQKTLDVRFPVFVLITKCDLIIGFREFFSGMKDPQLQNQMTGWSNGDPLDVPFRPEEVDNHLEQVVQHIGRRRLGLLKDPVAADAGARRVDEVDALFALPSGIAALAPRLRKYLETIFVANEWSGKPLFLRGIYFTSALTEGSALDSELASALGVPAESLPDGKAWERERSFFLRDLFLQKIFREQGLVTRATNTSQLIRRRQWILGGVVIVGLAALLTLSWVGKKTVERSVSADLVWWQAAADARQWDGFHWHPIVDKNLKYIENNRVALDENATREISEFHDELRRRVEADLRIPWIFKPFESVAVRANPNRRRAQRVLFEASVVGPLVEASRETIVNAHTWADGDADRLAALVELEGGIHLKSMSGYVTEVAGDNFLNPLLRPSLAAVPGRDAILDRFIRTFDWTYGHGDGRGKWPGEWLSPGPTLRENQPIAKGLDLVEQALQSVQTEQRAALQMVRRGSDTVASFLEAERKFIAAAAKPRTGASWRADTDAAWRELAGRRSATDAFVEELKEKAGVQGAVTLEAGYAATQDRMRAGVGSTAKRIRTAMLKQKAAAEAAVKSDAEFRLYRDIESRLTKLDAQATEMRDQVLPRSERDKFADPDTKALRPMTNGNAAYAQRSDLYAEAMARLEATGEPLAGHLATTVSKQISAIASARDKVGKYDGPLRTEFTATCRALLDAATVTGVQSALETYRRDFDAMFPARKGFPLGTGPALSAAELKSALGLLKAIQTDAADPALPADVRHSLEDCFARAEKLAPFATSLVGANDEPQMAKLLVIRERDQAATVNRVVNRPASPLNPMARVYPSLRLAGRDFRIRGLVDGVEIGRFSVAEKLPPIEFSTTSDPKPKPDALGDDLGDGWSLLRLLGQGAVRRTELEWDAVVRVRGEKTEYALAVTIVLEKPLPALDRWPAGTH